MSGFEIAGIVLGAIPLLISALENYGKGLSTLQRWRKYEGELRSLVRNLNTEEGRLQDVCEKLLYGLVPPSLIEQMISEPLGYLWRQENTKKKIRVRLWKRFDDFETNLRDLETAVDEMSKRIDSQRSGKVSEFKRAVFVLRRSTYTDLLATIKNCISNLESLIGRNIELEPARRVRSQGKLLRVLRDVSKSLHEALRFSLDCDCTHDVALGLERRAADITPLDDDEEITKDLLFQVAFSCQSDASGLERDAEKERTWQGILAKAAASPATQPLILETPAPPPAPAKGKGKTVKFATLQPTASSTTTMVQTKIGPQSLHMSLSSLTMNLASIGLSNFGASISLCEKIQMAQENAPEACYGTIVDQRSRTTRRYTVYPMPVSEHVDSRRSWSVISLREVLHQKIPAPSIPLSYLHRLQLAVVISLSTLQFHNTPWLPDTLSSRDIFFAVREDCPIYDTPYVMKPSCSEGNPPLLRSKPTLPFKRNLTLLSLGVLLTELILGQTLESLRSPYEESLVNSGFFLADYITTQRLMDRVRVASSNYGAAVSHCIDGELHNQEDGLDNEDFCHSVYNKVVALLEQDLENT